LEIRVKMEMKLNFVVDKTEGIEMVLYVVASFKKRCNSFSTEVV
jgi:hypothetical protein